MHFSFDTWDRIIELVELSAREGGVANECIIGRHGVPGVNENGKKHVELCAERLGMHGLRKLHI